MNPDINWRFYAACKNDDPEMFFDWRRYKEAKKVCETCPVKLACLAEGLQQDIELAHAGKTEGIWGGFTPEERAQMAGRRPQKRIRAA